MSNKDKKEARSFYGEHKIGFFEIIILGILLFLASWGTYSFGVWLVSGFK